MLRNHGKTVDESFLVELQEVEKFIGVQIACGILVVKNTPILRLWSKEWGHHIFGSTVSRDQHKELIKHLRFDKFSTRSQRRQTDKFLCFLKLGMPSYVPSCDLRIDKQLFPSKTRCPLVQYMPNKHDKFGINFWLLADVKSKYLCNGKFYLGKDSARRKEIHLLVDVCLWLMRPYFTKGYSVTTKSYFLSLKLAETLKAEKTTLLGTTRKHRKEVLNDDAMMKAQPLHSTKV